MPTKKKTAAKAPAKAKNATKPRVAKAAKTAAPKRAAKAAKPAAPARAAKPAKEPRVSKQAQFIDRLKSKAGISLDEAVKEFGWQAHTVRGAIAGAVKKKLGLEVESTKDEERGRVYRIAA